MVLEEHFRRVRTALGSARCALHTHLHGGGRRPAGRHVAVVPPAAPQPKGTKGTKGSHRP